MPIAETPGGRRPRVPDAAASVTGRSDPLPRARRPAYDEPVRPLKALLVLGWNQSIWVRTFQLPFAPFPGLGIRVDVYELVKVDSVVVGDRGFDVTCICVIEGDATDYTADRLRSLGFDEGAYP